MGAFRRLSDPELGRRGDAEAEQQTGTHLLYRYEDLVRARVRAKVPADDVDDVVHDVLLSAATSSFGGETTGQFVNWLKRIAARRIADYTRKHAPRLLHEQALDGEEPAAEDGTERVLDHAVVAQALAGIENPQHRETIQLWLAEDPPSREIAELVSISPDNVDQIKSRFRSRLRALLQTPVAP